MDKKELYNKVEYLDLFCLGIRKYVALSEVLYLIKQLDESQKVTVPQFVADFITEQKKLGHTLSYSIDACMSDIVAEWYWDNSELFARAWINGYEIEKEEKYIVRVKNVYHNSNCLNYYNDEERWVFVDDMETRSHRVMHTKEELIRGGFEWVFSCEGVEVEEVEE